MNLVFQELVSIFLFMWLSLQHFILLLSWQVVTFRIPPALRYVCYWSTQNGWHIYAAAAESHQSCPTLCNPIDSSPPGSPVPGILQARTLEWVAIAFSRHIYIAWSQNCFIIMLSLIQVKKEENQIQCFLLARILTLFHTGALYFGKQLFSKLMFQPIHQAKTEITQREQTYTYHEMIKFWETI